MKKGASGKGKHPKKDKKKSMKKPMKGANM